jgi:hypothetical protein
MPEAKPAILRRAISATGNLFLRWWREATGPLLTKKHPFLVDALLRRLWVLAPVILIALILAGAVGFYLFLGWRARDLTAKALASAEAGSLHFARRQIAAAANLRPELPAVQRATAVVESRLGNPDAVRLWDAIDEGTVLTEDEVEARAEIMTGHGDERQFAAALAALEAQGAAGRAAELRSRRSLSRGDLEQAIAQARAAASASDDPVLRLLLLRLLVARHGLALSYRSAAGPRDLAAAAEMTALIDGLAGTPEGEEALVTGLQAPYFPAEKKAAWAEAAWRNPTFTNPALLTASGFLAASGRETPGALYDKLQSLHVGAPLPRQAAFAQWMMRQGMHEKALGKVSAGAAAEDESMFRLRALALAGLGRWEEILQLADAPGKASGLVRLMVKSLAHRELGRRDEAEKFARIALRASAAEGRFKEALEMADRQDMRALADEAIVELCGDAAEADRAFALARDRFSRRGQFATLGEAYAAARQASPDAASVQAYQRYREILDGKRVDLGATAEAVAARPTDVAARFNHALALLQAGQAKEAVAVFDDFDVLTPQLPPGLQAVCAALLHAAGDQSALALAGSINPDLLWPGEYALIAPLRQAGR